MPVVECLGGELISSLISDDQSIVHSHYRGDGVRFGVALSENPENDDEYDGEPLECPMCDFEVDYPDGLGDGEYAYYYDGNGDDYVCFYEGCVWRHEDEVQVKSHFTREHVTEEDNDT